MQPEPEANNPQRESALPSATCYTAGGNDPISQQNAVRDMLAWGEQMQEMRRRQEEHDRKSIAEVMKRYNDQALRPRTPGLPSEPSVTD